MVTASSPRLASLVVLRLSRACTMATCTALLLITPACRPACRPASRPLYSGPVELSSGAVTGAVEGYITLYAEISEGSLSPHILRGVSGRCEDKRVCRVAIVRGDRGDEIRVAGKQVGSTQVTIKYVHPVRKQPGTLRGKVKFVAGRVAWLKVGQAAHTDERLLLVKIPDSGKMSCEGSDAGTFQYNGFIWESIMNDRVKLFECERPVELIKGRRSYYDSAATGNRWNSGPFGSTVLLCATLSADLKTWDSVSVYARDGEQLIARRGRVPDGLCQRSAEGKYQQDPTREE